MIVVVVMTMLVVVVTDDSGGGDDDVGGGGGMMPLMVGDDAIDGDVVGDGGRGAFNWGTCKCLAVWMYAPLCLPNFP